jgi:branched-chain amino acid transport system substrate-binding protein
MNRSASGPRSRRSFLTLAACSAVLAGCREKDGDIGAQAIRLGLFGALSGSEAGLGQYTDMGATLALEEVNAAGGVLGRRLEMVREDNRTMAGESATAVKKLLSRDQVVAVIGDGNSGRCLEAGPLCQAAGVPMVSPAATNPKVTEIGDCIFRVCFTDPFQGAVMARFARETLHLSKVGLLVDASAPYSLGLASVFRERFAAEGGTVVSEQRFSGGDKDFRAQLTALKSAGIEAVFAPSYYHSGGLILRQARDLGFDGPMLGSDGWEAPELLEVAGRTAEGSYFPVHFSPENTDPLVAGFLDRFRRRFGKPPTGVSALAFDTLQLIADAIRRAGSAEPPAIRAALASTRDFQGITGRISMDSGRNARKPAVIIGVRDGAFRFLRVVDPGDPGRASS